LNASTIASNVVPATGITYLWSGTGLVSGQGTAHARWSIDGSKTLRITIDATGCFTQKNVNVTIDTTKPTFDIAGDQLTCDSLNASTIASNVVPATGITYLWSGTGLVSGQGTAHARWSTAGTKTLTVTRTATGCFTTKNAEVTQDVARPTLTCSRDTTICNGGTAQFCVNASGGTAPYSYSWSGPNAFTSSNSCTGPVGVAGTYKVVVTGANGCKDSCQATLTIRDCGGHIFPTQTSCDMYRTGTATRLVNICYDKSSGKVSNAVPGVFFYWGKFVATATKETVKVIQSNSVNDANWLYRIHQGNQIYIYGDTCRNLVQGLESPSRGQGTVILSNAVIGQTYFLSVKYSVKSIIGASITDPIVYNRFSVTVNGVLDPQSIDSVRAKEKTGDCSEFGPQTKQSGQREIMETSPRNIPAAFALQMNYPNPFNPTTVIRYDLPEASTVRLSVFNILGQEVATLVNSVVDAGYQSVEWNTENRSGVSLPSGIYMYRLQATSLMNGKEFVQVNKMVLLK
jgi:hypothetical protein